MLREKCPYSEFLWSVFSRIRTEYGEIWSIYAECFSFISALFLINIYFPFPWLYYARRNLFSIFVFIINRHNVISTLSYHVIPQYWKNLQKASGEFRNVGLYKYPPTNFNWITKSTKYSERYLQRRSLYYSDVALLFEYY